MAMLGFAGIALAELKDHVPAAEQLGSDVFGVLLLSITFTLASLFPKFSTNRSLKVGAQGHGQLLHQGKSDVFRAASEFAIQPAALLHCVLS
jgi:hypothetical protein